MSLGYVETQLPSGRRITYIRNNERMNLEDAEAWCRSHNGHLPIPESAEENEFLRNLGNTWLGFRTTDMSKVTYTNWRPGEPSGDSTGVQLIASV